MREEEPGWWFENCFLMFYKIIVYFEIWNVFNIF